MSKIDIDKFFRDQFLEHEKNSASYNPDQWKNFEQLLDKKTGKHNNKKFGFSLNNLLFFMSSFVIVMLIPLLFLHSDTVKKSDANTETDIITTKSTSVIVDKITTDETSIFKPSGNKTVSNNNETESFNYGVTINNTNAEYALQSQINDAKLISEKVVLKNQNNKIISFIPVKTIVIKDTSTHIFSSVNSAKTKKEIKQKDTVITTRKGKIKRSKILLPHFYYNGF